MWDGPGTYLVIVKKLPDKSDEIEAKPVKVDPTASWRWVPASNGQVPPNAVVGGSDGENLYIARAKHEGSLIPGKLHPSHEFCYVSWGGSEHRKKDYEVLCNANGKFVQNCGSIPANAYPAGKSERNQEPLYIGRVHHKGTYTLGKVHPSHGVCYIPYGGKELSFTLYEIYVSQ